MKTITLETMVGGALQEQFAKAFRQVVENLSDPNTPFKNTRKICIELKFCQNEYRDDVSCAISVQTKLAAQAPMQTAFMVGKDLKSGEYVAEEYGRHNHLSGQTSIEDMTVDPGTGEVIEDKTEARVLDLRVASAN